MQLGPWLRDTQLFKQAWASAMETDERFWWTQQIFGFATLWSVVLGSEGELDYSPFHSWVSCLLLGLGPTKLLTR